MRFSAIAILSIALLLVVSNTPASHAQTCLLGKPFQSFTTYSGYATPGSKYKLVVDPVTKCANCPQGTGFKVSVVDMKFQTSQVCTIQVRVDVERIADPDDPSYDPNCPDSSPGPVVCQTGIVQIILSGGTQIASVFPDCNCLPRNGLYLLSYELLSSSCSPEPDIWTDGVQIPCTSWYNGGSGWVDLVTSEGFLGGLRISGDASCCEAPLPVLPRSWGAIKSLY